MAQWVPAAVCAGYVTCVRYADTVSDSKTRVAQTHTQTLVLLGARSRQCTRRVAFLGLLGCAQLASGRQPPSRGAGALVFSKLHSLTSSSPLGHISVCHTAVCLTAAAMAACNYHSGRWSQWEHSPSATNTCV